MGIIRHFDINWGSDNTDPVERLFLQDAHLTLLPANTLLSWVTNEDWHKQPQSLSYKFDVSMAGVLGLSIDMAKFTNREKQLAKNKIALYKEIRETIQKGDIHRLLSPFEGNRSVIQYVSKDKTNSVVFYYRMAEYADHAMQETRQSPLIKLRGLNPAAKYKIEKLKDTGALSGKYLMEIGVHFPVKGAFNSEIYKIEAVD